ncbi:carbohydrate porin [Bradyrhizobium sp. AZCC 2289]|uniref:carbohydrate porin n=1 Tax=Bradyrhizobium sp. AZCC 2289 TaxID=3117026 RepID=UPI002FEE67C8
MYRVGRDDDRGIGIFARISYSPPDRNLIDLYGDAGVEFVGLENGRPHDKFGIAGAFARVSGRARALDTDFTQLYGPSWPLRGSEALLTTVYQYELRPGWTLQPNFQFIRHPGGGATDPLGRAPGKPLKDASVFGVRSVLSSEVVPCPGAIAVRLV